MRQTTLARPVKASGIGVHTGQPVRLSLKPASAGNGLTFVRDDVADVPNTIPALSDNVMSSALATTIENIHGVSVSTVEHLLAACAGLGLDNAEFHLDASEAPIFDGSASVFCDLIEDAGLVDLPAPRRVMRMIDTVEVVCGDRWARLTPREPEGLFLEATIDYADPVIGRQSAALALEPAAFRREVAFARTFALSRDLAHLETLGLARGGSLDNAIVVDADKVRNPGGLRCANEFARHKVLDAIGDLALAGASISGAYQSERPGHALNHALIEKLLRTPEAWRWDVAGDDMHLQLAVAS